MNFRRFINIEACACTAVAAVFAIVFSGVANAQDQASGSEPVYYGRVLYSQLSDLAPRSASDALHSLMSQDFPSALPALVVQHEEYPDSLAIIAGLLQISISQQNPSVINNDISTLNVLSTDRLSDTQKFELATALYYHWSRYSSDRKPSTLRKAQELLMGLWSKNQDPVVGLMLADTLASYGQFTGPGTPKVTVNGILDQLICAVGGPAVAWAYTRAEASNWSSPPPGVASVPEANRFELLAVVDSRGSEFHATTEITKYTAGVGRTTMIPVAPPAVLGQRYFDSWNGELLRVLTGS